MRVRLHSMTSREIAHGLEHGEIDAGLTYLDNEPLADVDTLPLWREHYLLVTPGDGELGAATTVSWAAAAELPLCLLTPDMQHRRIVDGAFAAAGATPRPAVETQLGLDADRPRPQRPPRHHRAHLARRQPAARRPARDPARRPGDRAHDRARHRHDDRADARSITELLDLFAPLELDRVR